MGWFLSQSSAFANVCMLASIWWQTLWTFIVKVYHSISHISCVSWLAFPAFQTCRSLKFVCKMRCPIFTPKLPLPVGRSPVPTVCLILGPRRPTIPNGIQTQSAVFPQFTHWTVGLTDRQTDDGLGARILFVYTFTLYCIDRERRGW